MKKKKSKMLTFFLHFIAPFVVTYCDIIVTYLTIQILYFKTKK